MLILYFFFLELICAIGMGTCGLLPALEENEWVFKNYSMTGVRSLIIILPNDY